MNTGPTILLTHNSEQIARAFEKDAEGATQRLHNAIGRAAMEVAREAQLNTIPKFRTTLTTATVAQAVGPMLWEVVFGTHYAGPVNDGSGPGGWVPLKEMIDWIRKKAIQPRTPGMTVETLAKVIRQKIFQEGVEPQHFAERALENKRERVIALMQQAALDALDGTPA